VGELPPRFLLRHGAPAQDRALPRRKPITADDVLFSLDALKKVSHFYSAYYKNVTSAERPATRR